VARDPFQYWAIYACPICKLTGEVGYECAGTTGRPHDRTTMQRVEVVPRDGAAVLDGLQADAQRRLDAGDAPMVAAADLDALARVRRLLGD
jgi:hypothetical protein